jgi:heme A synthase
MEIIGKFFTGLILIIIQVLLGGYVIMNLWGWFISSTFEITSLSLIQAIGLSFFIRWMITTQKFEENPPKTDFTLFMKKTLFGVVLALTTLGLGWILHLFY